MPGWGWWAWRAEAAAGLLCGGIAHNTYMMDARVIGGAVATVAAAAAWMWPSFTFWMTLSLRWVLTVALTYVMFPWLLVPGLPADICVRLCFWLLPSIPGAVTPNFLAAIGLGAVPALALRLMIVQVCARAIVSALLSDAPTLGLIERLSMDPPEIDGANSFASWRLAIDLDAAAVGAFLSKRLATSAFAISGKTLPCLVFPLPSRLIDSAFPCGQG